MRCKEVIRLLNNGYKHNNPDYDQMILHAEQCRVCRDAVIMDRLASQLLNAACQSDDEQIENPYFMARLRARIRELSEHGVGSWESAVLALRGWLLAFGVAAVLLLTMSIQWQQAGNAGDQDDDVLTLSNISDDFIGGNLTAPAKNQDLSINEARIYVNK